MSASPIRAQTKAEIALSLRQGEATLLTLIIPVLGLVVVGAVHFFPVPSGVPSRVNFVLPGVIAFGIMASGMVAQSISTAFDRSYRVTKRLALTPLGRRGIIAAKLISVAFIELIELLVLVIVGSLMGWHPEGDPLVFLLGWVFGTAAFGGLGLLIGGTLRAELVLGLSNLLMFVLLALGAMAFPLASLPGFLATFAKLLPAAGLSTVLLHGMGSSSGVPLWAIVNVIAWGILAPLLAMKLYRWE